jgi:hypothetical protein
MTGFRAKLSWLAGASAIVLAACGGSGDSGTSSTNQGAGGAVGAAMNYAVTNLVSDVDTVAAFRGAHTDPNLVDAWGVAFNPQAFVWVANEATSNSTLYDGNGVPQSLVVAIPNGTAGRARPTGIVFKATKVSR